MTASQRYLSTRGGSYDFSFEEVVLKGLAGDGGLFIPEAIPQLPADWRIKWRDLSFSDLAFEVLSLYISRDEIPGDDLRDIVRRSYETFRTPEVTPLVSLDDEKRLSLLELFHGPTFAFKDVALQFLGNLFEYFLVRMNKNKSGKDRERLVVIGATSGDTGSAAIYGLRGKSDVSVFILYPHGRVSPIQEAQMTTVLDPNVHTLSVEGTFDDCQDAVKSLFADPQINKKHRLAAVNSINWARILAQMSYYFYSYFSLVKSPGYSEEQPIRFVVPSGNFGDILAGWFAKQMGLPVEKFVVATNENDILDRFWKSGHYTKKPVHGQSAQGGIPEDGAKAHSDGVMETLSPAMDILVSSNFERLLWFLAYDVYGASASETPQKRAVTSDTVRRWLNELKANGGFSVEPTILEAARREFESERVSDKQTLETINSIYISVTHLTAFNGQQKGYILDPHSAIGIAASQRSISRTSHTHHISLATAHPAKFANAVDLALREEPGYSFDHVQPPEFVGLEQRERRVKRVPPGQGWHGVRSMIEAQVEKELETL